MVRSRAETMAETREKLIAAARRTFAAKGFAESAMEDITAEAGLTRGALYHQFGGKKGLLEAVIEQIDAEMTQRLSVISGRAQSTWAALIDELVAYVAMAAEPEIQRIVLLDGPAVLGEPSKWPTQIACVRNTRRHIELLIEQGVVQPVDAEATARLVSAAALGASLWVANAEDPHESSRRVSESLPILLSGLLIRGPQQ
ncbi:TetR/AcrR family transcriptional regulator [Cupriavidus basilensis]|uniref:TetR/AcrR family transcriptional regulator n=1 Tax=Cupriavidus basilensis TaxID=68895 RepID=A0ABT6ALP5_9BURK|nr:TetR/AcrR family transcriptional regulator [Cupriavidus basilensis]MDF3833540.1 TetR/AcrR family transcriptional regulator [Cupriavidus basilensis]